MNSKLKAHLRGMLGDHHRFLRKLCLIGSYDGNDVLDVVRLRSMRHFHHKAVFTRNRALRTTPLATCIKYRESIGKARCDLGVQKLCPLNARHNPIGTLRAKEHAGDVLGGTVQRCIMQAGR